MKQRKNKLRSKISLRNFRKVSKSDAEWKATDEHRAIMEEAQAIDLEHRLSQRQCDKVKNPDDDVNQMERSDGIAFVKLYLTSMRGLNLSFGTAERDRESAVQSKFRQDLIDLACATDPLHPGFLWCHVLNEWIRHEEVEAAHIFSYKHGQEIMDAIFGRDAESKAELFSPRNGLLMNHLAEAKFDQGALVIVPNLDDTATAPDIRAWHACNERGYKIRITNRQGKGMNECIRNFPGPTWNDLDNQIIQFRSNYRPRSRYLYFHYLTSMLRKAWTTEKRPDALRDELGKKYWATPGPYLRKRFLKAFAMEVGHEFEEVVQGGEISEGEVEGPIKVEDVAAVGVAAQQVLLSHKNEEEDSSDDSDDSGEEFQGFRP